VAETARLIAKVETKGVKSATHELDKFSDAANDADGGVSKLSKGIKGAVPIIAKGAAALGAAATALTAVAIATAKAEKEWSNLASVSKSSISDFKATAFATAQIGISAEKLSDISKDTNEKLGEFIATGGGGFKDFFEEVAPQIGLTAKELQGLSGPDVLQRVKNAMDEANVSMEEQSFFLESIASDTTLLIPLLANEGAELKKLSISYDQLAGAMALTAEESKGIQDVATASSLLGSTAEAATAKLTGLFSTQLVNLINDWSGAITVAATASSTFFDSFRDAENQGVLENVNKSIVTHIDRLDELQKKLKHASPGIYEDKSDFQERVDGYTDETAAIQKEIEVLRVRRKELMKAAQPDEVPKSTSPIFKSESSKKALMDENPHSDMRQEMADFRASEAEAAITREADLMSRRESLSREFQASQEAEQIAHLNRMTTEEDKAQAYKADSIERGFSNVAQLSTNGNKTLGRIGEIAAIAQTTRSGLTAISNAAAIQPYPVGAALAITEGVNMGARLASIRSAGNFEKGGFIGGNSFSGDNITANVNSGEAVLNVQQQREFMAMANGGGGGSAPNIIINNNASGAKATAQTMTNGDVVVIVNEVLSREVTSPNSTFNKNLDATRNAPRRR